VLHIYDLSMGLASTMSAALIGKQLEGIWHTGVVIYGREFFYGGGICVDLPGFTLYGTPKQVFPLGKTQVPPALFAEFLDEASSRYQMENYSLLTHNCNNFTDECAKLLVGSGIPSYIISLPSEALATPMGQLIAPLIEHFEQSMRSSMLSSSSSNVHAPPIQSAATPDVSSNFAVNMSELSIPNSRSPSAQADESALLNTVHQTDGLTGGANAQDGHDIEDDDLEAQIAAAITLSLQENIS
jgi:hypothetical protein